MLIKRMSKEERDALKEKAIKLAEQAQDGYPTPPKAEPAKKEPAKPVANT